MLGSIGKRTKVVSAAAMAVGMMGLSGCETLDDLTAGEAGVLSGVVTTGACLVARNNLGLNLTTTQCVAVGILAGVVAGVVQNDRISDRLSEEDNKKRNQAIASTTVTGENVSYTTENGEIGQIEQTNAYQNAQGHECTSSRETITLGGVQETVTHNICKDADGEYYSE
ncbi:MAG: hypothetical protein AAF216_03735 [Pseudomonadota bacterium]